MTANGQVEFNLQGRRALVTGSASGIGLATAERLLRAGARVAMNDVRGDALSVVAERLSRTGASVEPVPGDLSNPATARSIAERALDRLGGLDYLVQQTEKILRRHPKQITILAPLSTFLLTMCVGTGHAVYALLPVISDVALRTRAHASLVSATGKDLPPDAKSWSEFLNSPSAKDEIAREPSLGERALRLTGWKSE